MRRDVAAYRLYRDRRADECDVQTDIISIYTAREEAPIASTYGAHRR